MIAQIAELYRAVHRELPDATIEEIRAAIEERGLDATPGQLALAICATRPDDEPDDPDDPLSEASEE